MMFSNKPKLRKDLQYISEYLHVGQYLGDGIAGWVFKSESGTVIKVSTMNEDAYLSAWLQMMRNRLSCFPHVYEVFELPSGRHAVWREDIKDLHIRDYYIWLKIRGMDKVASGTSLATHELSFIKTKKARQRAMKLFVPFFHKLNEANREHGIILDDAHASNIGYRVYGQGKKKQVVLRDLSHCDLPLRTIKRAEKYIVGWDY